jgi:uncharacterized protein DUF3108
VQSLNETDGEGGLLSLPKTFPSGRASPGRWLGWAMALLGATIVLSGLLGILLLPSEAAQEPRLPFNSGERLRYAVRWRGLAAGNAEIVALSDRTAPGKWKVTGKASSVGYVSNIYRVDDIYESQFRTPGFCSAGIHKQIQEGDRHHDVKLEFDPRRHLGRLEDRDLANPAAPPKVEQFAVPECVQDILSAVYYARGLTMTPGQTLEFPVSDGAKTIQIRVDVQGEEEVSTELGKFQAIRVEPDVFSGHLFSGKGRMLIWFSKDARRLPLQLRAQISVGTIIATLSDVGRAAEQ